MRISLSEGISSSLTIRFFVLSFTVTTPFRIGLRQEGCLCPPPCSHVFIMDVKMAPNGLSEWLRLS